MPVTVDNDATAAAWGESRLGARADTTTPFSWGSARDRRGIVAGDVSPWGPTATRARRHIIVDPAGLRADAATGMLGEVASGLAIARAGGRAVAESPGP